MQKASAVIRVVYVLSIITSWLIIDLLLDLFMQGIDTEKELTIKWP